MCTGGAKKDSSPHLVQCTRIECILIQKCTGSPPPPGPHREPSNPPLWATVQFTPSFDAQNNPQTCGGASTDVVAFNLPDNLGPNLGGVLNDCFFLIRPVINRPCNRRQGASLSSHVESSTEVLKPGKKSG